MQQPINGKGETMPLVPAYTPLAVTYDATISSATDLVLNGDTQLIEVTAIDAGIFMRYQSTASSTDFDEFIGAGQTRHFVKPNGVTTVSFIEEVATAKLVVIEKR